MIFDAGGKTHFNNVLEPLWILPSEEYSLGVPNGSVALNPNDYSCFVVTLKEHTGVGTKFATQMVISDMNLGPQLVCGRITYDNVNYTLFSRDFEVKEDGLYWDTGYSTTQQSGLPGKQFAFPIYIYGIRK